MLSFPLFFSRYKCMLYWLMYPMVAHFVSLNESMRVKRAFRINGNRTRYVPARIALHQGRLPHKSEASDVEQTDFCSFLYSYFSFFTAKRCDIKYLTTVETTTHNDRGLLQGKNNLEQVLRSGQQLRWSVQQLVGTFRFSSCCGNCSRKYTRLFSYYLGEKITKRH